MGTYVARLASTFFRTLSVFRGSDSSPDWVAGDACARRFVVPPLKILKKNGNHEHPFLTQFGRIEKTDNFKIRPPRFDPLYKDSINALTLASIRSRTPRNSSGVMSLGSGICQSTRCRA